MIEFQRESLSMRVFRLSVKVMPFANLMGLLASGTDSTAVLRCIQQVALLVQGNWVVKRSGILRYVYAGSEADAWSAKTLRFVSSSDVLYPKNTCSSHSGVPAELLCRGRDFVVSSPPSHACRRTRVARSPKSVLSLRPQMWRFTLERTLMRKEVAAVIKVWEPNYNHYFSLTEI